MMNNEQVIQAMQCSYEKYAAMRAEMGRPLQSPAENAMLPPWVLRKGEQPKTDWVMPKPAAEPAAAVVEVTAEPVQQEIAAAKPATDKKPESWAARVRAVIVAAKANGETQQQVLKHVVEQLGMKESSARNCIKFNWDRV